ncbi:creatininase family protein [Candidatus Bathyarchaeota archaeon]|nr:creatininase family protein [Candidatus Bathyarchaeota archaeon]
METIHLQDMTWPMVGKAIENGYKTVVVAVGSIEQHGHHLPLGTDTYLGDCIAERFAEKLGNTLVAPTIRPGCSPHHLDFPGTISITPETLIELLKDVCLSLDRHGFENIILVPSHGGNFAPVQTAVQSIAPELNASLIAIADLMGLITLFKQKVAETGQPPESAGGHAGAGETSFMLAYKPELVRKDAWKPGYIGPFTSKYVRTGFKAVTPTGVLGDPTKSSREAGEKIIDAVTDMMVAAAKRELGL